MNIFNLLSRTAKKAEKNVWYSLEWFLPIENVKFEWCRIKSFGDYPNELTKIDFISDFNFPAHFNVAGLFFRISSAEPSSQSEQDNQTESSQT